MPQGERLPDTWKAELGSDWAQTWQSLRHTLGNLTLTAFNPEMGNKPFRDKRDCREGIPRQPAAVERRSAADGPLGRRFHPRPRRASR